VVGSWESGDELWVAESVNPLNGFISWLVEWLNFEEGLCSQKLAKCQVCEVHDHVFSEVHILWAQSKEYTADCHINYVHKVMKHLEARCNHVLAHWESSGSLWSGTVTQEINKMLGVILWRRIYVSWNWIIVGHLFFQVKIRCNHVVRWSSVFPVGPEPISIPKCFSWGRYVISSVGFSGWKCCIQCEIDNVGIVIH
jgi:hypothetical protein